MKCFYLQKKLHSPRKKRESHRSLKKQVAFSHPAINYACEKKAQAFFFFAFNITFPKHIYLTTQMRLWYRDEARNWFPVYYSQTPCARSLHTKGENLRDQFNQIPITRSCANYVSIPCDYWIIWAALKPSHYNSILLHSFVQACCATDGHTGTANKDWQPINTGS